MKLLHRVLLLGLMGWFSCVGAADVGVTDTKILIGMTSPLSGPNGAYGTDMKDVISAYFKQVNDTGGVNGRKLELIAMDDGYETDRTVANTKVMNNDTKVFAMVSS